MQISYGIQQTQLRLSSCTRQHSELSAIVSNSTPTTIAIGRKRSFTISADKTVVVARTLGACAVFFLFIATTTRLLWASFGATLGQFGGRSKAFQALFLYLLERLSLDLRKGDFRFSILCLEQPRSRRLTGSFLQILASFCVSQWRKWQF